MSEMYVIEIMKETVHDLPEENIKGIFLPRTEFSSSSVGVIEPYQTQTKHFHNRVGDGVEIVFIYSGKCVLLTEDGESVEYDTDKDGPVFLSIPTKTIAHIKNTGASRVFFFSVFAPGLVPEEINFLN